MRHFFVLFEHMHQKLKKKKMRDQRAKMRDKILTRLALMKFKKRQFLSSSPPSHLFSAISDRIFELTARLNPTSSPDRDLAKTLEISLVGGFQDELGKSEELSLGLFRDLVKSDVNFILGKDGNEKNPVLAEPATLTHSACPARWHIKKFHMHCVLVG